MESGDEITGPINLGNPEEFTIRELANQVLLLTESKSKLEFLPLPEDDPKQRKPDIGLAKAMLNWSPKIGLREGLLETIRYFEKTLSGR
jgi:UDP-glucuronate decarboxylase